MQVDKLRASLRSFEAPVAGKGLFFLLNSMFDATRFVERNVSINVVL